MIKSLGQAMSAPVDLIKLRESGKAKAATPTGDSVAEKSDIDVASTPAARMAAHGAPIDMDRVAAIKAAIASGNYPVDPARIAEKMIALDLSGEG